MLENLALSPPSSNQDVVLSLLDWRLAAKARREGDSQWALLAKAAMDRARLAIARHADGLAEEMQPAAKYIGEGAEIEQWSVDLFSEEVIRGGPRSRSRWRSRGSTRCSARRRTWARGRSSRPSPSSAT